MILVFGTVCLDRIRQVPFLPPAGGYVEITDEQVLLGGEAANTAVHLKAWNANVTLSGNPVGQADRGPQIVRLLHERGLVLEPPSLTEADVTTPICDIYVTPDGDRTMFGKGFSKMAVALKESAVPFKTGEWFTADPNMDVAARNVCRSAIKKGMRAYLMDFFKEDDPVMPGSFWQSSTDWVGTRGNTQRNVEWVKAFIAARHCFAILSDGPNGFVAGAPDHPVRAYPPFPAPPIVDTTGAGDAFRAGMLLGLDEGWPIADCLRFASAAGCLSVAALGGSSEVPSREKVLAHIAAYDQVSRQYA